VNKHRGILALSAFVALVVTPLVHAQAFPSRAVRIVVPFPAGGSFDVVARVIAQHMRTGLGQNVVVDDRPGGGTVVGTELVARQPPDGYTMLLIGPSFTSHAALRPGLSFDTDRDFRAVSQLVGVSMIIAVNPSFPAKSVKELVALAKARPGQATFGTSGVGTSQHLLLEALRLASKADIVHAPFQGANIAVTAAIGGHVSGVLVNVSDVLPFVKAGKLKALVVSAKRREEALPDVQTAAESGHPELEATNWGGLVVHSATPTNVVARLNVETVKALNNPDVRALLKKQEFVATPSTPDEFAALIKSDGERYRRIIREANVRLE
jgi:tripartite-type tricarboxylate transporter receptor subunit TctC